MPSAIKQRLDYADYRAVPPDGKTYQILDGNVYVTPAPSPRHQRICRELFRRLDEHVRRHGSGEVFFSPIDVILGPHDIVQPDLVVVAEPGQVSDRGIEGAPRLVVEVLSRTTRDHDLGVKTQRYAALGVPHYWIVDPEARRIECLRLEDGRYRRIAPLESDTILRHPDWPGLRIELAGVWADS